MYIVSLDRKLRFSRRGIRGAFVRGKYARARTSRTISHISARGGAARRDATLGVGTWRRRVNASRSLTSRRRKFSPRATRNFHTGGTFPACMCALRGMRRTTWRKEGGGSGGGERDRMTRETTTTEPTINWSSLTSTMEPARTRYAISVNNFHPFLQRTFPLLSAV